MWLLNHKDFNMNTPNQSLSNKVMLTKVITSFSFEESLRETIIRDLALALHGKKSFTSKFKHTHTKKTLSFNTTPVVACN